jgi:hypothetical protein
MAYDILDRCENIHELVMWEMTALPASFVFNNYSELRVCVIHKCHDSFDAYTIQTLVSTKRPQLTILRVGACPHLSAAEVQDIFCRQSHSELKAISISEQPDFMFSNVMQIVNHNKRLEAVCVMNCNPLMYGALHADKSEGCDFKMCVNSLQKVRAGLQVFDDVCCMKYFREYLPPRSCGVECRCNPNNVCVCLYGT